MNASELNLRAVPAREVIKRTIAAGQELWAGQQVTLNVQTNVGTVVVQGPMNETLVAQGPAAAVLGLAEANEFVLCSFLHLTYSSPGNTNRKESFRYQSSNGFLATIQVQVEPTPDPARSVAIVDVIKKHFALLPIEELVKPVMAAPEIVALQLREAAVVDLHAQLAKLGGLLTTITERDVELRSKRMADLEAEYQARVTKFEQERAAANERDEEHRVAKQAEIDRQAAELKKKADDLDDRNAKHRRRERENDINKVLDGFANFTVSENTKSKRGPITFALLLMAAAFAGLAVVAGYDYLTKLDMHYLPASTTGLIGFSATMLFYVKWSDRWFREHADEEVRSKRYKADMLRASWIAELTSEWVKEGAAVPPELIEVFARDLFVTQESLGETEHAADAVLGLIKRAKKIDVSNRGVTLDAGSDK